MPYASDSDLTTRIPATSSVAVELRTFALADAANQISDAIFGDQTIAAQCYLAAHILALDPGSGLSGGGGIVTARRAGAISVSYAAPSTASLGPNSSTAYGQQYDRIASRIGLGLACDDPTGAWQP